MLAQAASSSPGIRSPLAPTAINQENDNSNILIVLFFLIFVIFFLLLFIFRRQLLKVIRRIRRQNFTSYSQAVVNLVKSTTTFTSDQPSPLPSSAGTQLTGIISTQEVVAWNRYSRSVNVEDFEDYVKDSIASEELESQYKMLPRGPTRPYEYGSLPENKSKNRYQNIIAYDDSRVILKKTPDDNYSDYINANYIPGFRQKNAYIATQGPKPQTVVDFWRMVWQEEAPVICMLANVVEGKRPKCEQYWPEFGDSKTYGDIVVVTEDHQIFTDHISRTLRVSCKEESRKIKHLHYTGWPDHTVPMHSKSVIVYLKKLQSISMEKGPIIVHCSAGVGRTGTIILCDICIRQATTKGTIDVLGTLKELRDCRPNMVDNILQYLFVHVIIAEYLSPMPTELDCYSDLTEVMERMKKELPQHIKRLRDIAWQDEALDFQPPPRPALPEQLAKNRFPELAPANCNLVYLPRYPIHDNNSDYISAVVVDGPGAQKQFLASQLPLPSTLSDFWRLIAEERIELVIILQEPDLNDPTCCAIIPDEAPLNPVPFINVELKTTSDPEKPYKIVELLLTDSSKVMPRTQRVTMLICTEWEPGKAGKPPSPDKLVELWIASENIHREEGPTLVLCHDGVTGCGLYLALSFMLETLALTRECDIIFSVRLIRRSRAEFVQSQEQFEYLYDAAARYIESFETYSNFTDFIIAKNNSDK